MKTQQTTNHPAPRHVSIIGMGHVGCVLAACLASDGHFVVGVDDESRLRRLIINHGPDMEKEVQALFYAHHSHIAYTSDVAAAVKTTDVTFVCLDVPLWPGKGPYFHEFDDVTRQIGEGLRDKPTYHSVILRSPMTPYGTRAFETALRASSGRDERSLGVCYNPSFLREGHAIKDFNGPPFTVIGTQDANSPEVRILRELYDWVRGEWLILKPEEAEMLKLTCDAWHALKVNFANEIGEICHASQIDSQAVMGAFIKDKLLNISQAYLKPGFAFGGSGLPRNTGALNSLADKHELATPVLKSILSSNDDTIELARLAIGEVNPTSVGILGMAFKPGTHNFHSPARVLATRLREDSLRVLCFDADSPHREEQSLTDVLECDVVVLASNGINADVVRAMVGGNQTVVDLVGALDGHLSAAMMPRVVKLV